MMCMYIQTEIRLYKQIFFGKLHRTNFFVQKKKTVVLFIGEERLTYTIGAKMLLNTLKDLLNYWHKNKLI